MFGKPNWFRPKRWGWGLTPITWQGWLYTLSASGIMVLPFLLLLSRGQVPEALIWMAATMAVLVWDVKQILSAYHAGGHASPGEGTPPSDHPEPGPTRRERTLASHFRFCCPRRQA